MTDETNPTAVTNEQPIDRTLPGGIVPEDPTAPPVEVAAEPTTEPKTPTPEAAPEVPPQPQAPSTLDVTEEVADPRDAQPHDPAAHTQR